MKQQAAEMPPRTDLADPDDDWDDDFSDDDDEPDRADAAPIWSTPI